MKLILVVLTILLSAVSVSAQTTFYVSTTGNNANDCTQAQSTSTPKLTLASALGCVTPGAGDIIKMRGGTYAVGVIDPPSGTSYANALTITNYPGETVTINGIDTDPALWITGPHSYVIIGGDVPCSNGSSCHFVIDAAPTTSGNCIKWTSVSAGIKPPDHIRLINAECKGANFSGILTADRGVAGQGFYDFQYLHVHDNGSRANLDHGLYLETPSNLVEYVDTHDNAAYGLQFDNGPTDNSIARFNKIYHNAQIVGGGGGVYLHNTSTGPIDFYNNLIYNNNDGTDSNGYGIQVRTHGAHVYNNTFYANVSINLYVLSESDGSFIRNNISYGVVGSPPEDARLEGTVNVTFENNLIGSSSIVRISDTGTVLNNNILSSNPLFLSTITPDLHIPSNSPAKDMGQDLSAILTTDYDGNTRPQGSAWDIGAYESRSSASIRLAYRLGSFAILFFFIGMLMILILGLSISRTLTVRRERLRLEEHRSATIYWQERTAKRKAPSAINRY